LQAETTRNPPKKNIYNIHQALPRSLPIFLQAQTPTFDENLLKILIEKTYNQPLTKTKKTRDEKF
jgi:hypothetical protein